jgi:hypothetical protein
MQSLVDGFHPFAKGFADRAHRKQDKFLSLKT